VPMPTMTMAVAVAPMMTMSMTVSVAIMSVAVMSLVPVVTVPIDVRPIMPMVTMMSSEMEVEERHAHMEAGSGDDHGRSDDDTAMNRDITRSHGSDLDDGCGEDDGWRLNAHGNTGLRFRGGERKERQG
jgi:hypothetical protein